MFSGSRTPRASAVGLLCVCQLGPCWLGDLCQKGAVQGAPRGTMGWALSTGATGTRGNCLGVSWAGTSQGHADGPAEVDGCRLGVFQVGTWLGSCRLDSLGWKGHGQGEST